MKSKKYTTLVNIVGLKYIIISSIGNSCRNIDLRVISPTEIYKKLGSTGKLFHVARNRSEV